MKVKLKTGEDRSMILTRSKSRQQIFIMTMHCYNYQSKVLTRIRDMENYSESILDPELPNPIIEVMKEVFYENFTEKNGKYIKL